MDRRVLGGAGLDEDAVILEEVGSAQHLLGFRRVRECGREQCRRQPAVLLAGGMHEPARVAGVRGEAGHDIIAELYPLANESVIDKPGKGAFFATDLHAILQNRGITQLVVTGVTTEVCVNTTVREANDRGYRCVVLADCCASYNPEFHEMGLKMIKAQGGIFGWVASSPAVIAALIGGS